MDLFKFEEKVVNVLVIDREPLFDPFEIGVCLELAEGTVRNKIQDLEEGKHRVKLTNSMLPQGTSDQCTLGNFGKYYLTERGVYKMID